MKENNQHIEFDKLIALYYGEGELSLKEVHEYKKHLYECEDCQAIFEDIEAFDKTELLKPHLANDEKRLEDELLNITKQHIKESKGSLYPRLKSHLYENGWKYIALVAASFLLVISFTFSILNNKPDTIVSQSESFIDFYKKNGETSGLDIEDCAEYPTSSTQLSIHFNPIDVDSVDINDENRTAEIELQVVESQSFEPVHLHISGETSGSFGPFTAQVEDSFDIGVFPENYFPTTNIRLGDEYSQTHSTPPHVTSSLNHFIPVFQNSVADSIEHNEYVHSQTYTEKRKEYESMAKLSSVDVTRITLENTGTKFSDGTVNEDLESQLPNGDIGDISQRIDLDITTPGYREFLLTNKEGAIYPGAILNGLHFQQGSNTPIKEGEYTPLLISTSLLDRPNDSIALHPEASDKFGTIDSSMESFFKGKPERRGTSYLIPSSLKTITYDYSCGQNTSKKLWHKDPDTMKIDTSMILKIQHPAFNLSCPPTGF